jgi:GT2 family glycosyltransferase
MIVVDNGSTDGSASRIGTAFPEVEVLELDANLGYAGGNNVGLTYALAVGADYILILNNDTLVHPSMLAELIAIIEEFPQIGMAGPTMYCVDPANVLFAAGSFIHWARGSLRHRGMFEPATRYAQITQPGPVDFIVGCGVLVQRKVIEAIGGYNPAYYLNFEDVEWGVKAWQAGFEVWHVPQAMMWHKVSATLGRASPANTYYMTRNALLFFWRNAPDHLRWLAISHILLRTLRTISAWTLKPRYHQDGFRRKRDANLLALRDFFQGRFGEMGPDVARICYGG